MDAAKPEYLPGPGNFPALFSYRFWMSNLTELVPKLFLLMCLLTLPEITDPEFNRAYPFVESLAVDRFFKPEFLALEMEVPPN